MNFWQLWKKELKGFLRISTLFMALWIILTERGQKDVFVWFPPEVDKWGSPFGVPMGAFFWFSLWAIGMAFHTLHHEWRHKSIYLLMSLPVKGYQVLGAKVAAIVSGVLTLLPLAVGMYLFSWHEKLAQYKLPALTAFYFGITVIFMLLAIVFILSVVSQFAFLVGKLVKRFRFVLSGTVFYLILAFLHDLLMKSKPSLIRWIPDLVIRSGTARFEAGLWFFLPMLLAGIGLLFVNSWLYGRRIEL